MIFGVDLGTRRIALACPEAFFVWSANIDTARGRREFPDEIAAGAELGRQSLEAIAQFGYTGHVFYYERPLAGFLPGGKRNIRTAVGQGLSAGAALTFLPGERRQITSASEWKKELCGNGSAKPADYRRWLEEHQPSLAALCGQDEDRSAAFCIGLYGAGLASRSPVSDPLSGGVLRNARGRRPDVQAGGRPG